MIKQEIKPAEMYEQYFVPVIFTPWTQVLLNYVRPQKGDRVLDLACGTGIITRNIASDIGDDGRIVACDFNPEMIEVAREQTMPEGADVEFRIENAIDLHLPDNAFDLIICQQGFQFFPDKPKAAAEMKRVLDKDGKAVLAIWQSLDKHDLYRGLFEAEAELMEVPVEQLSVPFSLGNPEEVKEILLNAGFKSVEVFPYVKDVKFPQPEKFLALTLLASAAVIPDLTLETAEDRAAFLNNIKPKVQPVIDRHRDGDFIKAPMACNFYIANA